MQKRRSKFDASFLHLVEKELCKKRIASGEARERGKSESSTSSEMRLDDLDSTEDKEKKEATYGPFLNSKKLKDVEQDVSGEWI